MPNPQLPSASVRGRRPRPRTVDPNPVWSREKMLALLGLIGLVQFVPLFLLTPVVGLVADSVDRRWIARGAVASRGLAASSL